MNPLASKVDVERLRVSEAAKEVGRLRRDLARPHLLHMLVAKVAGDDFAADHWVSTRHYVRISSWLKAAGACTVLTFLMLAAYPPFAGFIASLLFGACVTAAVLWAVALGQAGTKSSAISHLNDKVRELDEATRRLKDLVNAMNDATNASAAQQAAAQMAEQVEQANRRRMRDVAKKRLESECVFDLPATPLPKVLAMACHNYWTSEGWRLDHHNIEPTSLPFVQSYIGAVVGYPVRIETRFQLRPQFLRVFVAHDFDSSPVDQLAAATALDEICGHFEDFMRDWVEGLRNGKGD